MKLLTLSSALFLAVVGSQAMAEPAKTRAEVKAELAEAIRTGDIVVGESSLKLNERFPHRYPAASKEQGKTRDQVKAELAEAIRTGDILASGDSGLKLNEIRPDQYPAVAQGPGKTRAQVQAELAEAIRTGDMAFAESSIHRSRTITASLVTARALSTWRSSQLESAERGGSNEIAVQ